MSWIILLYLSCSLYMAGIIWLIQLLHYPSFLQIDKSSFLDFHTQHTNMMTLLVGPVMIAELVLSLYLSQHFEKFWLIQSVLVVILFLLTFLVSVPIHNQLAHGFDKNLIQKLISTNWPRTIIWTIKAILLVLHIGSGAK